MPAETVTVVRTTAGDHELPAAAYERITTLMRQGARFIEAEKRDGQPVFVRVEEIVEVEAVVPEPGEGATRAPFPWES